MIMKDLVYMNYAELKELSDIGERAQELARLMRVYMAEHDRTRINLTKVNIILQESLALYNEFMGKYRVYDTKERECLHCDKKFISNGFDNRMCPHCIKLTENYNAKQYEVVT